MLIKIKEKILTMMRKNLKKKLKNMNENKKEKR